MNEDSNGNNLADLLESVPTVFSFCSLRELQNIIFINKRILGIINGKGDSCGYWQACCVNLSKECGLYITQEKINAGNKQYFFSELWLSREKFKNDSQSLFSFKIQVASRFRPGSRQNKGITVPLHQFLKVKRQMTVIDKDKKVLVGTLEPEHYLDPILGTIMKDPVMLNTSGRIVDRSVAIQYLLRGGRDPFSNKKMTNESLIPQVDLKFEIAEWKKNKYVQDVALDSNEVKMLVDDISIDPDIISALIEAQQLNFVSKRAISDLEVENSISKEENKSMGLEPGTRIIQEADLVEEVPEVNNLNYQEARFGDNVSGYGFGGLSAGDYNHCQSVAAEEYGEHNKKWNKQKESPKLLEVSNIKCCVSMNVPGTGF